MQAAMLATWNDPFWWMHVMRSAPAGAWKTRAVEKLPVKLPDVLQFLH